MDGSVLVPGRAGQGRGGRFGAGVSGNPAGPSGMTVAAMAAGEITPDESLTVTKVLDRKRRALEARVRRQARAILSRRLASASYGEDFVKAGGS
jgi:hypothetical protein